MSIHPIPPHHAPNLIPQILNKKNYKKAACLKQTKKSQHFKKNSKKLKLKKYVILKITSHDLCLNRDAKKSQTL